MMNEIFYDVQDHGDGEVVVVYIFEEDKCTTMLLDTFEEKYGPLENYLS